MRITFYWAEGRPDPWLTAFRAALPEAEFSKWALGDAPADYAVVWAPPQAFFDAQPQLKAVFNMGAGVDALMKVNIAPATQVVRLDDAGMSVQMAEYVCHAVIRHFRELDVHEADTKARQWLFRKPRMRADFPVGVLGLGVLGSRVARALRGFEFPVNGWSRNPKAQADLPGVRCFAGLAELPAFLAASKVLVCLLPLTPETENILNADHMSLLQKGGYVINVARGGHLVDADLIALLDNGHLAGATLDVFRQEPLPQDHPFWAHRQITLTPHTSARTLREETVAQIAQKIQALSQGLPIAGVVNRDKGY